MQVGAKLLIIAPILSCLWIPYRYFPLHSTPFLAPVVAFFPTVATVLTFLAAWIRWGRFERVVGDEIVWATVGYWGIALVSSATSANPWPATGKSAYFLAGFLPYLVILLCFRTRREVESLTSLLAWMGILLGAYCWLEAYLGSNPLFEGIFSRENPSYWNLAQHDLFQDRVRGPLGHPVIMGSVFVLLTPMAMWKLLTASRLGHRAFWLVGIVLLLGGLFLTYSRGAWLALGVMLIFYLTQHRNWKILLRWGMVLAGLFVLILFFSDTLFLALARRNPYQEYLLNLTHHGRVRAYLYAMQIIDHHLLLGLGTGQYAAIAHELGSVLDTPDNMYLSWLTEAGALGLTAALGSLYLVFRRLSVPAEVNHDLLLLIKAGIVGFTVNMLIADLLNFPVTRLLFWICVGMGASLASSVRSLGHAT